MGGGMKVNRKNKTNIITLNACSFQEPECTSPGTRTQERTVLRREWTVSGIGRCRNVLSF